MATNVGYNNNQNEIGENEVDIRQQDDEEAPRFNLTKKIKTSLSANQMISSHDELDENQKKNLIQGSRKEVWRVNESNQELGDNQKNLEAIKKQNFAAYYEGSKLDEWKEYYLKYEHLKCKIETTFKDLFNYFKSKTKPGQSVNLPKNHIKIKTGFIEFEDLLVKDLNKVSSFYHEEEVKVLSLTYDLMNQLKMITVTDFSKVQLIMKQMESCTRELMDLVFYIKLNTSALKHQLRKFDDTFQAFHTPFFKDFFKNNYNTKDSPIKMVLEHQGTIKCYFQLVYIKKVMDEELGKIYLNHNINSMDGDFTGKCNSQDEQEVQDFRIKKNLFKIRKAANLISSILHINSRFFKEHKNNLWKSLGLNPVNYYNEEVLLQQACEIFQDEFVTKDDFIHVDYHINDISEDPKKGKKACYSMVDLWFVILHTFLFMTNYYALSPTAYDYVEELGYSKSLTGIVSAATPITETAMSFLYNWMTNKTYKWCIVIGWICCALANLSYGCAQTANSLALLILGRVLLGAGGARIVTRKFVALMVVEEYRTTYSAIFVALTALGKTGGPGLSSVFQFIPSFDLGKLELRYFNMFSFIAFVYWCAFGIFVTICFQDIKKQIEKVMTKLQMKSVMFSKMNQFSKLNTSDIKKQTEMQAHIKGVADWKNSGINFQQSKINVEAIKNAALLGMGSMDSIEDLDDKEQPIFEKKESLRLQNEESFRSKKVPGKDSSLSANPQTPKKNPQQSHQAFMTRASEIMDQESPGPIKVYFPNKITIYTFFAFMFCKSVQESFFYEIPQVMYAYYDWTSRDVGFAICASSVFAIPIALSIAPLSKKVEDRQILFWSLILYLVAILMKINYQGSTPMNLYLYLVASGLLFVGSLITETAAISIMSKVISPTQSVGLLNAGFVSGLGDTGGRSLGNIMVAVCGSIGGVDWLPTILYSIYAVIITIITILCWVFYDELQKLVYVQLLTTATEKGIKEMTKKEKGKDKYLKNHPQEQVFNHSLIRYNRFFQTKLK